MDFATSRRRFHFPSNWYSLRKIVLKRAHYKCEHVRADTGLPCGRPANQVDHILNWESGGSDDLSNLQALCEYHHSEKTSGEGARAANARRLKRKEQAYWNHPAFR